MSWDLIYDEIYDEWDSAADVENEVELRLAVLEWILSWKVAGPPEDADWDPDTGTFECAAPGTPVFVQFAVFRGTSRPAIFILGIRSPR